jgi:hypothetical protein
LHDEAGPAADVGILFDLRILETIEGILQEVDKRCGENDAFERVNRRPLNRDVTGWADQCQSAFQQRRRRMGCGNSETSSRWRGTRQLWGIKVRCGERKASRGRRIPRRERQKIRPMTTNLVDVSVVLGWRRVDGPSNG